MKHFYYCKSCYKVYYMSEAEAARIEFRCPSTCLWVARIERINDKPSNSSNSL